mmetsp:Transcript_42068/g.64483  ORF Transcript_42068/g.64483 Transcript_42068/m.64483 type:complete len:126 (+) Transcript_42068:308-685(+)
MWSSSPPTKKPLPPTQKPSSAGTSITNSADNFQIRPIVKSSSSSESGAEDISSNDFSSNTTEDQARSRTEMTMMNLQAKRITEELGHHNVAVVPNAALMTVLKHKKLSVGELNALHVQIKVAEID